jgi:hypothetical protein
MDRYIRRLQGNLAYLAAIADGSHKPSSQIPAHPQVRSAPPLTSRSKTISSPKASSKASWPSSASDAGKTEPDQSGKEDKKEGSSIGELDDIDQPERLKDLRKRLQALFPGVDPKKEQTMQQMNAAAMRARAQASVRNDLIWFD